MSAQEQSIVEVKPGGRPSLGLASWRRFTIELLQFRRSRESVFFTIAFPLVMLALFGTIFGGQDLGPKSGGVTFAQYFIASMVAAGVWGSCFTNLAISVPTERDSGALKRLAGTPMPMTAYFAGKIGLVLLLSAVETVLLLAMGLAFYNLHLPSPEKWLTFGWVMTLGITSCTLLGLAVSGLVRNARTASADRHDGDRDGDLVRGRAGRHQTHLHLDVRTRAVSTPRH